jgi:hypothetical protein
VKVETLQHAVCDSCKMLPQQKQPCKSNNAKAQTPPATILRHMVCGSCRTTSQQAEAHPTERHRSDTLKAQTASSATARTRHTVLHAEPLITNTLSTFIHNLCSAATAAHDSMGAELQPKYIHMTCWCEGKHGSIRDTSEP